MTNEQLMAAKRFMRLKHEGQYRKTGEPYYFHPLAVAYILKKYGFGLEYQITGLFHDLLEDTDATVDQIRIYGNDDIAHAVQLLTKVKGYIMEEYIYNLSQYDLSKMPKLADRLDNINPTTFKKLPWSFRKKYIDETETYYPPLYEGTPFFDEFQKTMKIIKSK